MRVLLSTAAFLTVLVRRPPSSPQGRADLGRHLWWTLPPLEALLVTLSAGVALAALEGFRSPPVAAAVFVALDQALHGFRRLDGFSDLAEGLFYRLSNPDADRARVWEVVRSPQNGPYGTALLALLLLLTWSLDTNLLALGWGRFFLGVLLAGLFSKLAMVLSIAAPGRFDAASDFAGLARQAGRPLRLLLLAAVVLFLAGAPWALAGLRSPGDAALLAGACAGAAAAGLAARYLALLGLGGLNGDLLGFSWCLAEVAVLAAVNLAWAGAAERGGTVP